MELKARDDVDDLVLAVMFYQGKTGRPPTTRELAQMLGLNSASTVLTRVDRAVALGLLRRDPGSPRSIRVPAHD
jgi:SOS-response transcriptional repressor LexA